MKKIYWIGDMINNTGPAIVNKSYYPYLKNKVVFYFNNKKIPRIINFILNLPFRNIIVVSGFSKLNYYMIRISNIFHKKTIYIMHGYVKEELEREGITSTEKSIIEYKLLSKVDKVICVSKMFCKYMKAQLPDLKLKFDYVNNGVQTENGSRKILKDSNYFTIISIGGGSKNKNNLIVCEAIKKISKKNIRFIVVGKNGEDGKKIRNYPFVDYYESLSHDEVLSKMCKSNLYIQNSFFETFGLSVVEALSCGCDILVSKNIGALSILKNISCNDIIINVGDIDEIVNKIKLKIKNISNITYDKSICSWKNRSLQLLKKIERN